MKYDNKSFQERYEAWKNGADYWKDIRGINLGGGSQEEPSEEEQKELDSLVTNILSEYNRGKGSNGNDSISSFVGRIGPLVGRALNRYGYGESAYYNIMRLLAYESNYGTSNIARKQHNYGGVGFNGKTYTTYKSDEDFVNNYIDLMRNKYDSALRAKTTQDYARELKQRGYYQDTLLNYTRNLMGMNTLAKTAFNHRKKNPDMYNYNVQFSDLVKDFDDARNASPIILGTPSIELPLTINATIPRTLLGPVVDLNKLGAENLINRKLYEEITTPTLPNILNLLPTNNFGKDAYGLKFWLRKNNNLHFDGGKDYNSWSNQLKQKFGLDTNDPTYDYKLYYNRDPKAAWAFLNGEPGSHFTDYGKTPLHQTFSTESAHSNALHRGGSWGRRDFRDIYYAPFASNVPFGRRLNYIMDAENNGAMIANDAGMLPKVKDIYWKENGLYGYDLKLDPNGDFYGGLLPLIVVGNHFNDGKDTGVLLLLRKLNSYGYNLAEDNIYGRNTLAAYQDYLKKQKKQQQVLPWGQILDKERSYNNDSNTNIINGYHQRNATGLPYIIDDKKNRKLSVYVDGIKIKEYEAIHGKNSNSTNATYLRKIKSNVNYTVKQGDVLSIIAKNNGVSTQDLAEANGIKDLNFIKPGLVLKMPGYKYKTTKVDPDEQTVTYVDKNGKIINLGGNLTTPAGVYFSNQSKGIYNGAPSFVRQTREQINSGRKDGIASSIHARTITENANTNGCTGLRAEDMKDLSKTLGGYKNIPTYILPSNKKNKFFVRNNLLQFKSHDTSKTASYNTITSSPINKIVYSTNGFDDNLKKVTKQFASELIAKKRYLQKDLGINNDTYNELSLNALGILGNESQYGKLHTGVGNFLRLARKAIFRNSGSPDYKSKYDTYGIKGDNNSVGLTQIRFKYLSSKEKALFKKYGITKDDLVNNPRKAAIATMIKLAANYKNSNGDMKRAINMWNSKPTYYNTMISNRNRFKLYLKY